MPVVGTCHVVGICAQEREGWRKLSQQQTVIQRAAGAGRFRPNIGWRTEHEDDPIISPCRFRSRGRELGGRPFMMAVHCREYRIIERDLWIVRWTTMDFDEKITSTRCVAEDIDEFQINLVNIGYNC